MNGGFQQNQESKRDPNTRFPARFSNWLSIEMSPSVKALPPGG